MDNTSKLKNLVDKLQNKKESTEILELTVTGFENTKKQLSEIKKDLVNLAITQGKEVDGVSTPLEDISSLKGATARLDGDIKILDSKIDKNVQILDKKIEKVKTIKGEKGERGEKGEDGYTPIKGKDYFDGKDGIDGVTRVEQTITKVPLTGEDVEKLATDLTELPREKKMTTKAIRDFREETIRIASAYKNSSTIDAYTKTESDARFHPLEDQRLSTTDDVSFTSLTLVNAEGEGIGVFSWDSVNGTPQVTLKNGSTLQIGQEMFFYGKATENILNGDAVQFAGVQGDHILIKRAVGSELDLNPQYFVGVATQNIALNNYGYVTWFGKVNNVYTKTPNNNDSVNWSAGDILYININTGYLTNSEPAEPYRRIRVASVIKEQTGSSETGVLIVRPDIGVKLQDLNDVDGSNPTTTGDLLTYDLATGVWERGVYNIEDYLLTDDFTDANIQISDITTNNATTLKHGFLPKLSGSASQYLNGQGNYATISGSSVPSGYSEVTFSEQTSVNVVHDFGIKPIVQVIVDGDVFIPYSIAHNTDNDFTVSFTDTVSGSIIVSAGSPKVPNIVTTSSDYDILVDDNIIIVSAFNKTITLPTAVGVEGKLYTIDNASNGNIFVTGSETIQGEVTQVLPTQSSMVVYSTGANWRIT